MWEIFQLDNTCFPKTFVSNQECNKGTLDTWTIQSVSHNVAQLECTWYHSTDNHLYTNKLGRTEARDNRSEPYPTKCAEVIDWKLIRLPVRKKCRPNNRWVKENGCRKLFLGEKLCCSECPVLPSWRSQSHRWSDKRSTCRKKEKQLNRGQM